MRVLVLGGTRFIGAYAVRRLVERGHEVTVFHRGEHNAPLPGAVQHIHGDRTRLSEYAYEFRGLAPDVVLDMRALSEADGQTLLAVFKGITGRLVVISSGDVYRAYDRLRKKDPGPPDPTPLTEDSPLRDKLYPYRDMTAGPEDPMYSYDKILLERAAMSNPDLPATVLRLPMVFGPGDYQHRLYSVLKRMMDRRPFILLPEAVAGWRGLRGYVEDMAEAIALCVVSEQAAGRTYHVADQDTVTEREWVEQIARAAGWRGKIIVLPDEQLPAHLRHDYDFTQDWSLDSARIRKELGYRDITPHEVAMERTVEWEGANPPEKIDEAEFDYAAEDAVVAGLRR
jgi:nucleoside-diphosphate-sugar epimerase